MSSIVVGWRDEARNVVLQEHHGAWTWQEATEAVQNSFDLIRQSGKPGALVVDMRDPQTVPSSRAGAFGWYQKIRAIVPLNLRLVVVVGAKGVVRTLAETFMQAVGTKNVLVMFVDSQAELDEALEDFYSSAP